MSSAHPEKRRRRGTTTLEMAFITIPLLYMIFGFVDLGRFLYSMQSAVMLGQYAARVSVLNQNPNVVVPWLAPACGHGKRNQSSSTVAQVAPLLPPETTTVCQVSGYVPQITVQVAFLPIAPGLNFLAKMVQSSAAQACTVEKFAQSYGPGFAVCPDSYAGDAPGTLLLTITVGVWAPNFAI